MLIAQQARLRGEDVEAGIDTGAAAGAGEIEIPLHCGDCLLLLQLLFEDTQRSETILRLLKRGELRLTSIRMF